jgi:hypothetical protein
MTFTQDGRDTLGVRHGRGTFGNRLHDKDVVEILQRTPLSVKISDFSVVLFRPNFMLASEGYLVKVHKNQRLLTLPSPPNLPCGVTHQGTYHGVWWTDAFAVT